MVEWWNDGMMEWWNGGMVNRQSSIENRKYKSRSIAACLLLASQVLLFALGTQVALAQADPARGVAFLPFENRSDFSGAWNVSVEVPRFMSAYVKSQYDMYIVSAPVSEAFRADQTPPLAADDVKFWLRIRRHFGVRFLLTGSVERFDVSRFSTGAPELGSYEAYKGEISFSFEVIDLERLESRGDAVPLTKGAASGEFADRSFALTLLAKPSARTVEFRDLNSIQFGSDDFNRTVIGRACLDAARMFTDELATRIPTLFSTRGIGAGPSGVPDSMEIRFNSKLLRGRIVFLEGEDVFIDLGSEDRVRAGQVVPVYAPNADTVGALPVGSIRVIQLRGPHLSLTRIVAGKDSISTKHSVRVQVID